ncbi:MAG: hypothetical protein GY793_05885 [Proteobacteria bacterium]|nr:hypothetical protein [Pseudomonadota bacterium]
MKSLNRKGVKTIVLTLILTLVFGFALTLFLDYLESNEKVVIVDEVSGELTVSQDADLKSVIITIKLLSFELSELEEKKRSIEELGKLFPKKEYSTDCYETPMLNIEVANHFLKLIEITATEVPNTYSKESPPVQKSVKAVKRLYRDAIKVLYSCIDEISGARSLTFVISAKDKSEPVVFSKDYVDKVALAMLYSRIILQNRLESLN